MLIGREKELAILKKTLDSEYSEFLVVYGRRRVGKTFLIREAFDYSFTFQSAGLAPNKDNPSASNLKSQLDNFVSNLKDAGLDVQDNPKNWREAFELLKQLIKQSDKEKKIIFLDELAWMNTRGDDLVTVLESFWNGWASARRDIILIICASSSSWIIKKIIHNKGGLYNRLSQEICLSPFTLGECEEFANKNHLGLSRYQIIFTYMALGGVAYYWSLLEANKTPEQNFDLLFSNRGAPLANEYKYLFSSLFNSPENYKKIVAVLNDKKTGFSREELLKKTKLADNGLFTNYLEDLENCGFIRKYRAFGKKNKDSIYQLIDNFTLFYFKFIEKGIDDEHYFQNMSNSSFFANWKGLSFEMVCLKHDKQIKKALGISGVSTEISSWRCSSDDSLNIKGHQIDLIISRKDNVINLCEMKYSTNLFEIDKKYAEELESRVRDFITVTGTKNAVHLTMITTYGIKPNNYSSQINEVLCLDSLFE